MGRDVIWGKIGVGNGIWTDDLTLERKLSGRSYFHGTSTETSVEVPELTTYWKVVSRLGLEPRTLALKGLLGWLLSRMTKCDWVQKIPCGTKGYRTACVPEWDYNILAIGTKTVPEPWPEPWPEIMSTMPPADLPGAAPQRGQFLFL